MTPPAGSGHPDAVDLDLERVADKLRRLARADPHLEQFGAEAHRYVLRAPLPEAEVARIEVERGVTLPDDYRRFLTQLGDGGAGPDYGLGALAQSLMPALDAPFPYVEDHDLDDADPAEDEDAWDDRGERPPWRQGVLAIGDKGCGYYNLLVVTGPARGQVFFDYTAAENGFVASQQAFLPWYEGWLDRALADRDAARHARDEAARGLHAEIAADSRDVPARVALARLHLETDRDPEAARRQLQEALRYSPGHPEASLMLGRILETEEDWVALRSVVDDGLPRAEAPSLRAGLLALRVHAEAAHGAHQAAADAVDEALRLDKRVGFPADGPRLPGARAHAALGNLTRARGLLRSAPQTPLVRYELGKVCFAMGALEEAETALDAAARAGRREGRGVGPVPDDVGELLAAVRAARPG